MVLKKIDNRIRVLIENGVTLGHRSMFAVVGEKAKDQVVILHHMLTKAEVKARPSVLWCYKKELGFSTHRMKRKRLIQKKMKAGIDVNQDDPFELFISSTNIRWCYYNETHRILGNTFGMLVLQDFEAITPNLLARTIETVEGGGVIVFLLNSLNSLKQLYTLTMDVHARYRTEAHQDIVARFNERFILSLSTVKMCMVIDDKLNVLPISSYIAEIEPVEKMEKIISEEDKKLEELKISLADTQPVGSLVSCCKTLDQATAVLKFIDTVSDKSLQTTISLTAARGRGKSAALGLALAGAIAFNYSNIFVTSPSPENLKTLFDFVLKGLEAVHLKEHLDYEVIYSNSSEITKSIVRINIFKEHRQTIQYIDPMEAQKNQFLSHSAELLVIDEAAAIPLPIVKNLFGPYLIFMASTVNGYEGTGRSLSLKLIKQLRQQNSTNNSSNSSNTNPLGRLLHELTLNESIRYKSGDPVEKWINNLLCLDDGNIDETPKSYFPHPNECRLFYINRDTLFSYHKASERFLQKLMSLYAASHYKNSPNDLQMISDAPAHHLFCLLPPLDENMGKKSKIPEVLCFLQVCLEGEISSDSILKSLSRGKRASGDLIPWTVSQQFQDTQFALLSGVRIVRIATRPGYEKKGYGTQALKLLEDYYSGKIELNLADKNDESESSEEDEDKIAPRKRLGPLLLSLSERKPEMLDYMGVSFGLTTDLLIFWKKNGYLPVYLRQTSNDITGEHSCIMIKMLKNESSQSLKTNNWLKDFWIDFRRRFISLLSFEFRSFKSSLALNIIQNNNYTNHISSLTLDELKYQITAYDLKRLELYSQNLADYHLITDLLPTLARIFFLDKLGKEVHFSVVQCCILLSIGLQHKNVDEICEELNLTSSQVLGLFTRTIKKLTTFLRGFEEKAMEERLGLDIIKIPEKMDPMVQTLDDELREEADKIDVIEKQKLSEDLKGLSQYEIKGAEDAWRKANKKSIVNIKRLGPKKGSSEDFKEEKHSNKNSNKRHKFKKQLNKRFKSK